MRVKEGMETPARALTIAGSDSGGGAGIQADLKTFQELGVYGMSALTALTAQNTMGVQAVFPVEPEFVAQQIRSVGADIGVDAMKTGMLFSGDIIRKVAETIRGMALPQLVVDPVMIAKGGAALLQEDAIQAVITHLLPLAAAVTPNIPEAEALTGIRIAGKADKREAARRLHGYGVRWVIVKGGHDEGDEAVDLLYDGHNFHEMSGPRVRTKRTHGTGCTFSAALTACLAQGMPMEEASASAKRFIQAAIEDGISIGSGHGPTNHWAYGNRLRQRIAMGAGASAEG